MREIPMESSNNRRDNATSRSLLPPKETFSATNELDLMDCWPKGPFGNAQTTQVIVKAIGFSPQTDGKALAKENSYTPH